MNYFDNLISLKQEADKLQQKADEATEIANRARRLETFERTKRFIKALDAVLILLKNKFEGDWFVPEPHNKVENNLIMIMIDGDLLHFKKLRATISLKTGVIHTKVVDVEPVSIQYLKSKFEYFNENGNWSIGWDLSPIMKDVSREQLDCIKDSSNYISILLRKKL